MMQKFMKNTETPMEQMTTLPPLLNCMSLWVMKEQYSPHRSEPHGLQRLLQQHTILWELPTQTVNLWQWDITGTSSLHQTESLGTIVLLEHQIISMVTFTE